MVWPDYSDGIDDEPLASDLWDTIKNAFPSRKRKVLGETVSPPPTRKRPAAIG